MARSLQGQGHPLAVVDEQRRVLRPGGRLVPFEATLEASSAAPLVAAQAIAVLQLNLGKLCNQTCKHCHVDAGPDRREVMNRATMVECLNALAATATPVVDLTGGAPEMNPEFRWLVGAIRDLGRRVIDRCNLTILLAPGYRDLPEFLAEHRVEIVASLPYFLASRADAQRGAGVFESSIAAIRRLNALGYGVAGSGLTLDLAYNPTGPFLPGVQGTLEADFRRELADRQGVAFNRLLALANLPISRFLEYLLRTEQYEEYMARLITAFNPEAVANLMCRTMLSVGWDGRLHDCDFNQMLDLPTAPGRPRHIRDFDPAALAGRPIATGLHCYGCTAGAGSSCGGAVLGT